MAFYDVKMFCLIEKNTDDDFLSLSYYQYSPRGIKLVSQYEFNKFGEGWEVAQANNTSKIVWWNFNQKGEIKFNCYSLSPEGLGQFSTVRIDDTING